MNHAANVEPCSAGCPSRGHGRVSSRELIVLAFLVKFAIVKLPGRERIRLLRSPAPILGAEGEFEGTELLSMQRGIHRAAERRQEIPGK